MHRHVGRWVIALLGAVALFVATYRIEEFYGLEAAARRLDAWIAWMLDVSRESLRVSRGLVLWVCSGDGGSHSSIPRATPSADRLPAYS